MHAKWVIYKQQFLIGGEESVLSRSRKLALRVQRYDTFFCGQCVLHSPSTIGFPPFHLIETQKRKKVVMSVFVSVERAGKLVSTVKLKPSNRRNPRRNFEGS